jgi:hypothetical protein
MCSTVSELWPVGEVGCLWYPLLHRNQRKQVALPPLEYMAATDHQLPSEQTASTPI